MDNKNNKLSFLKNMFILSVLAYIPALTGYGYYSLNGYSFLGHFVTALTTYMLVVLFLADPRKLRKK